VDALREPIRNEDLATAAVIDRLRRDRSRRPVGVRLDAALAQQNETLKKLRRRLGSAGSAWAGACPEEFSGRTRPIGLRAGVLRVAVSDASTRYRVDRWLRAGGLVELQRASAAPLRRVKLEIGLQSGSED